VRGLASHFVWTNRSKESLTLDLKHPRRGVLDALLERADVLVQNLAPGAAARLGLSYEALRPTSAADRLRHLGLRRRRALPRPEGLRPADPERVGLPVGHRHARRAGQGRLLDRRHLRRHVRLLQHPRRAAAARRTGRGCHIDVSMLESMVEWMGFPLYYAFDGARRRRAPAPRTRRSSPTVRSRRRRQDGDARRAERARVAAFLRAGARAPALATDPRFAGNPRRVARATNCAR
jgi:itaconate CoA-transferase